jgi:hypothetical protein
MLQFAELEEVFPTWTTPSTIYNRVEDLEHLVYRDGSVYTPLLTNVKEGSKFRVIDGKLQVDNRKFQSICRKISGDSRWKILKVINNMVSTHGFHQDIIIIVKIIYNGCYKNDKKWKAALNEIIPERYLNGSHGISPICGETLHQKKKKMQVKIEPVIEEEPCKSKDKTEESSPPPYTIIVEKSN